ncbi:3'-5' exonuclease [Rossellomorea vietnamensis]|nr:3'-5' exonuclease [Rossellomorea vietnamensis]
MDMAELKQFIFFDFEMKCDDRGMAYENMEAIRLGAVKYDLQTRRITSFDRFIQPATRDPLSPFCKNLTGIDDRDLETADPFPVVYSEFLFWTGGVKKSRFFSWSKSDLSRLKIDSHLHGLPAVTLEKIEKRYVDFQDIFSKGVSKVNLSVENALAIYGAAFEGEAHHPMYDSYNTLRVFLRYYSEPVTSDIEMARAFILNGEEIELATINERIKEVLTADIAELTDNLHFAYRMTNVKKLLKKVSKTVGKYDNILINRSGIFTEDILHLVHQLNAFNKNLLESFQEHLECSSRIMIIDDYSETTLKNLK